MDKPAETQYPIEEILRRRWSPRSFSERLVEPEKLQSLFEAARWAPSSFNEQPWNMIVQATALGLFVHQMAGFSPKKVSETYGVPDGFEPVAAIATGYGPAKDELPEAFREFDLGARKRKPTSGFVFEKHWGEVSPLVSR